MSTQSQYTDIFQSELMNSTTVDGLFIAPFKNGLLNVKVPKYFSIDLDVLLNCQKYIRMLGEDKNTLSCLSFPAFQR